MINKIKDSIDDNNKQMNALLPIADSYDLLQRDVIIGGRNSSMYFISGFSKDNVLMQVLPELLKVKEEDMPDTAQEFVETSLPYAAISFLTDYDQVIKNVLSGVTCLFIDQYNVSIALDCRAYPARGIEEPSKDKSLRGSRDGFVETIIMNTTLIRRRLRTPDLITEMREVGSTSKTDVCLCYMKSRVDQELLDRINKRLDEIDIDALSMNQQTLANYMNKRKWFNPFPKFKFTERPDTTAECITEGKVAIMVDNAPSAMILPTSIFDLIEEANDYYFPTITNVYLKITRLVIILVTLFLTPTFMLLIDNPQWIPPFLDFILIQDELNLPIIWQFLILESAIDGLKLAAINTPGMLSTPLSIVAGIVLGQFSVSSGWFNAEIMLYMSFVAVANYTQPNFELGYALKFMRLIMLILTAIFGTPGYIAGVLITIYAVITNRTLTGRSFLHIS